MSFGGKSPEFVTQRYDDEDDEKFYVRAAGRGWGWGAKDSQGDMALPAGWPVWCVVAEVRVVRMCACLPSPPPFSPPEKEDEMDFPSPLSDIIKSVGLRLEPAGAPRHERTSLAGFLRPLYA
jgi:hypothetical protein